jgi:surface protein
MFITEGSTITCATIGSNGDADIYIKFGSSANNFDWDQCAQSGNTSNEKCTSLSVAPFGGVTAYLGVHAYRAYTGLTVTCTMNQCFPDKNTLGLAIEAYINQGCSTNSASCTVGQRWGWPIGTWCTTLITDMSDLFRWMNSTTFNEDISGWDVSSVKDMTGMFFGASAFNQVISAWDVSSVTGMGAMFYQTNAFNQDISRWDVSSVTDMGYMFVGASVFNQDISRWNLSSVTHTYSMFVWAYAFNQDISRWDVSSVIDMHGMFYSASAFNQDISGWDVRSVLDMSDLFNGASAFNQNLCAWKNTIPYTRNNAIFTDSGCTFQTTPISSNGPFCAVDKCSTFSPTSKAPTSKPTFTPTTKPPTYKPTLSPTTTKAPTAKPT